ncbi:hypothetical protein [Corynebacterium auriscanis]|uniref:hypothetical protein n=1 Tax=Corynebacterium auriscanis TaxID=99807 RepID=UPI0024ACAF9C|nr:hypothetical protein [Corynebacterium auriscanis]
MKAKFWAAWSLVHAIIAVLALRGKTSEDVTYYYKGLHPWQYLHRDIYFKGGPAALQEYPDAGTWPLRIVDVLTPDDPAFFRVAFVATMALVSGLFTHLILQLSQHHPRPEGLEHWPAIFWLLFTCAAYPVILTRLDLVPGVLVAVAALWCATRPRVAAFLLGLATMSKLWPGVLAATFVGHWKSRGTWVRLIWFALSLVALGLVTVVLSGPARLTSPLSYQDVRGLQIESLAATPFILAAALRPSTWQIEYAASKSYEISGPGVEVGIAIANALTVMVLLVAIGFAGWRFLKNDWSGAYVLRLSAVLIILLIVGNKVLSPQYLIWLGPLVAVLLATHYTRAVWRVSVLLLVATFLTLLVYPATYTQLTEGPSLLAALILVARNVVLLGVAGAVGWLFFTDASRSPTTTPAP